MEMEVLAPVSGGLEGV